MELTAGTLLAGLVPSGAPRPQESGVLAGSPLLIAHRGGAALAPENTIVAFARAIEQWAADMIELDVRASADGHCIVIHDATVDRTTDGRGEVAAMPLAQLKELDAGYRFPGEGATFPFRGTGIRIPTIEEVLERLPHTPLTVELKTGTAQQPLLAAIERFGAAERVVVAGMNDRDRTLLRGYPGPLSASSEQLVPFFRFHLLRLGRFWRIATDVVQIPEFHDGRRLVTRRLIRDLHSHGLPIHVWTVNDEADMRRLLEWGVDGLVTDRPDRLGRLLHERNGRPLAIGWNDRGDD